MFKSHIHLASVMRVEIFSGAPKAYMDFQDPTAFLRLIPMTRNKVEINFKNLPAI